MKVLKVITHDLRNGIKHPKRNNKKEGRAAFRELKSLAFSKKNHLLPWSRSLLPWTGIQLFEE